MSRGRERKGQASVIPELGIDPTPRRETRERAVGVNQNDLSVVAGNLGETAVDRLDGVSESSGMMGVDQTGRRHRSRWHGVDEDGSPSLAGIGLKPGRKQIELLQQKLMALACILAPLRRMRAFEVEQDDKRITRLFPELH